MNVYKLHLMPTTENAIKSEYEMYVNDKKLELYPLGVGGAPAEFTRQIR